MEVKDINRWRKEDWMGQAGDINREVGNRKGLSSDLNPLLIEEVF